MTRKGEKKITGGEYYRPFFWFVIGSCIVLIPLMAVMTKSSLDRQERFTERLLKEKGEALIRSYEAGVRAAEARNFGPFERQKLVIELARQPGVDYIIVTDEQGLVVADSEPFRIGGFYGPEVSWDDLSQKEAPLFRKVKNISGADTFEVYRPLREESQVLDQVLIFVGLDMGPILEAHREDVKRTIFLASVLVLLGMTCIIALFLTYRYREASSSLAELRLFSHYLLEHLPVGVVSLGKDGQVILMNEAAGKLLEIAKDGSTRLKAQDTFPPEIREILSKGGEDTTQGKEVEWKGKDGSTISAEIMATKLADQSQLVLMRDMREVKKLREEVERSRRLAAIGSLAAGVAHEIRNPLSSIKGFATYFREKFIDDEEAKGAAQIMITEIERLNRVITELLSLARPPDLKRQYVKIRSIIDESVKTVARQFEEKGVEVSNEMDSKVIALLDPDQMKQVFLNLLLNALDATDRGGRLIITGEEMHGGRFSITFTDTGKGINPKDLPHVFDPFFTTKPSGTGLGLSVAHKIIEAHGGEITITSIQGSGTEVKITMPKE